MIKAVLFDLDGTLLPLDQDEFIKFYFSRLVKALASCGYKGEELVAAVWRGTEDMVKNDGKDTNETVFWRRLSQIFGEKVLDDIPVFDRFYKEEFSEVKKICGFNPEAKIAVDKLKAEGFRVALATNPVFPHTATEARIRWAGLSPDDFELVTTYENSRHCKPNPAYYIDIAEQMGLTPEECLMVGNDAEEDTAAGQIGMKVFLLTDSLINRKNADISAFPRGSFSDLMKYISEKTAEK